MGRIFSAGGGISDHGVGLYSVNVLSSVLKSEKKQKSISVDRSQRRAIITNYQQDMYRVAFCYASSNVVYSASEQKNIESKYRAVVAQDR